MSEAAHSVRREVDRWGTDTSDGAAWDARALVDQLRKGGDPELAVEFGERAAAQWPAFEPLRGALAWAFYGRDIAPVDPDEVTAEQRQRAKDALTRIRELVSADPYGRFSAWPLAALQVARVALTRWPRAALDILDQLEPSKLSTEHSGDYPSNAGRWHLAATKALEEISDWSELLRRCDVALGGDSLRPEDGRWIRRRRAFALEHLGRLEEAVAILRDLQLELPEWWVEADLARALAAAGHTVEATEACKRALVKPGELGAKWRTVALLGDLVAAVDPQLAGAHYQLARNLRLKAGWPADRQLETTAAAAGITGDAPPSVDLTPIRKTWQGAADPARSAGTVKTVLPGEHSGFITVDDGRDVYFSMPRNNSMPAPASGTRVTFRLVDSFDKKKNQPSQRATDVRLG